MINGTYIQLFKFYSSLSIKQLMDYKDRLKHLKNKPFLSSLEILKIKMKK